MARRKQTDLEKYLMEPAPILGQLESAGEAMAPYLGLLQLIPDYEKRSSGTVASIKDGKTHNGRNILSLISNYRGLREQFEGISRVIGNKGYTISVDGKPVITVDPKSTTDIWRYRLNWMERALEGLFFIYQDDIKRAIAEDQKSYNQAKKDFKI